MSKTRQNAALTDDDDDDVFDENGVMRDGARWRVPMRMLDSIQRDVIKHFGDLPKARDADGAPLGQPGFTRAATARDKRNTSTLYDEYDADIGGQWKNPPTGVGSNGFVGCQVGDLCTVRFGAGEFGAEGAAGHLRTIDGELVCVADGFNPSASTDRSTVDRSTVDPNKIKDPAYASYDQELSQAYKRAR